MHELNGASLKPVLDGGILSAVTVSNNFGIHAVHRFSRLCATYVLCSADKQHQFCSAFPCKGFLLLA